MTLIDFQKLRSEKLRAEFSFPISFFGQRVFGEELWIRGWGIDVSGDFLPEVCLLFPPKTLRSKVLSFLALHFRVLFVLGLVFGGFWEESSDSILESFRGVVSVV